MDSQTSTTSTTPSTSTTLLDAAIKIAITVIGAVLTGLVQRRFGGKPSGPPRALRRRRRGRR